MHERCPSAVLVGSAMLADYHLSFTIFSPKRQCGCADIIQSLGDTVYGLLYRLTDADMDAMDGFEGHPIHYRRITVRVNGPEGETDVYSYEVVNKKDDIPPSVHYLGFLQTAAVRFNFPEEYRTFLRGIKTL
jgi:hypothetical protein